MVRTLMKHCTVDVCWRHPRLNDFTWHSTCDVFIDLGKNETHTIRDWRLAVGTRIMKRRAK